MRPAKRGRPKLSDDYKKKRINISLNKYVYKKLREKGYNISRLIEMLLTLFIMNGFKVDMEKMGLARGRLGVQIPLSPLLF